MSASRTLESGGSSAGCGPGSNHPTGRISIGVFPAASYHKHFTLLEALQDIFFVSFRPCRREEIGTFRFALLWEAADALVAEAQRLGVRCLVFPLGKREAATCAPGKVSFADVPAIDEAIRGQYFMENKPVEIAPIATRPGELFATLSGLPIWIRSDCGAASVDYLAIEPRPLNPGTLLREQLHPHSVSHLLPLLHFVREAAGEGDWDSGPRQACFVIDDPSLYRPSYGCVNFGQLAKHATQHGYHVAVATIPLDTWWVHQEARSVFRDYPEQMSLTIHGNNHTYLEMSRECSGATYLSLLAQALRRYSRLEKEHGLKFSRVFEAPHGVIASEVFGPLVSLGYEAALYTPSQFINRNRNSGWPTSFGSRPVDVSPQGLCVIPRLIMSRRWRAEVSIAAFLRQPIVLAGHHRDLFAGLELLSEFATHVNALGNVRWSNLSEIASSRFTSRREGSSWVVRLGARAVEFPVPSGVTQIIIERPWIQGEAALMKLYGITETSESLQLMAGAVSEPLPWRLEAGGRLRIESPPRVAVNPDSVARPPKRMWPLVRKMLVEAADRSYPFLPETLRRLRSKKSCSECLTRDQPCRRNDHAGSVSKEQRHNTNVTEFLLAGKNPDRVALRLVHEEHCYGELQCMVEAIARYLVEIAGQRGDRVILLSDNSFFWVASYLGVLRAGLVCVPLPTGISPEELDYILGITGARFAFLQAGVAARTRDRFGQIPIITDTEVLRLPSVLPTLSSAQLLFHVSLTDPPLPVVGPDDLAALMFTSGSTGRPRGVMVSHANIMANTESIIQYLGLTENDRIMAVLPFHYCFGTSLLHTHLRVGASLVIGSNFTYPEVVLQRMLETECTGFAGVPSHFQLLLRSSSLRKKRFPHLRYVQQAGGHLAPGYIRELKEALPETQILVMYGQTEGTSRLSYLPPELLEKKLGSIGKGIPGVTLHVLNESGGEVRPGEVGEIVAEGENIARGYWRAPAESATSFRNGLLYTGDLATVDEEGFIYIAGRAKDFVKCGGKRVSCRQLEDRLLEFEELLEAAVVGMPDDILGEAVKAFIVPRAPDSNGLAERVLHFCKDRLPYHLVPREIIVLDALPKNSAGKVLKQNLKAT